MILSSGKVFSSNDTNFLYELRETKEERTNNELPENKERRRDNEKFKHKQEKPSGFETLCHQDPSCPVNCNVCCMLPYHTKTGKNYRNKSRKVMAPPPPPTNEWPLIACGFALPVALGL